MDNGSWRFAYETPIIRSGIGSVDGLEDELDRHHLDRALVVCGRTVGQTSAVMDPLQEALGDRLVGIFDETTPDKRFSTAAAGAERFESLNADVLIGVGGGSSLDITRVIATIAGSRHGAETVRAHIIEGDLSLDDVPPVIQLPTTLAGAALSDGAGLTIEADGELINTGISHRHLMPHAVIADPALAATTPPRILRNAAMNGFNKGIESLYARTATPITDATAMRGLTILRSSLPALSAELITPTEMAPILDGMLLVQYGRAQPGRTTLAILHAFGHAFSRPYPVQQGLAHAVVTPAVLEYVFDQVDGRRALIARALHCDDADDPAEAIVESVTELRDALSLPTRIGDLDGPQRAELPAVADGVLGDHLMANNPPGLDPSRDELIALLEGEY